MNEEKHSLLKPELKEELSQSFKAQIDPYLNFFRKNKGISLKKEKSSPEIEDCAKNSFFADLIFWVVTFLIIIVVVAAIYFVWPYVFSPKGS